MESLLGPTNPLYKPKGEAVRQKGKPVSAVSAELVAHSLRQSKEPETEYNPDEIRRVIQNATLNSHSLEDLFRTGRTLTRTEKQLEEIGEPNALRELQGLKTDYENKVSALYTREIERYEKITQHDIPKFISSLKKKPNWNLRLFPPKSAQITKANKLINELLDFQEVFNKLASSKDIGLSVDGHEGIYTAQLGMIPDIHEHIKILLEKTSEDINKVLTQWHINPTERTVPHGAILNWGNGCYGISVMQALGATKHFAALNSQVDTANPPATLQEEVQQQMKEIQNKVERGISVSLPECRKFFETIFNSDHKDHFNPEVRGKGKKATYADSIGQHDAADFTRFLLDKFGYQFTTYIHIKNITRKELGEIDRPPQNEIMIPVTLSRQKEPLALKDLMGKRLSQLDEDDIEEEQILTSAPPILPVHLCRFTYDTEASKIKTPVEVPIDESLKVKVKKGDQLVEQPYSLKSFIVHIGNTVRGGHYITYRRQEDGWICCNDGSVTAVPNEKVKEASKQAYTLFFEKQEGR